MASSSKLCLKIKLPAATTSNITGGGVPVAEGGGGELGGGHIVCEYCGKRFSSGKAWGGHKRHHLQMKRKQQQEKEKQQSPKVKLFKMKKKKKRCRTIYAGDVTIKDGTPICCLCYKVFPSLNSLFGHMRFHPERDWRGIQPPPQPQLETKAETETDLLSDLVDLVGWKKKDKRGRACISDIIPQAARDLITLSRHSIGESELVNDAGEVETEFPTGQSLGGHNRCHWKPSTALDTSTATAIVASASSSSSGNANRKLNIDLNKPYFLQDNADE